MVYVHPVDVQRRTTEFPIMQTLPQPLVASTDGMLTGDKTEVSKSSNHCLDEYQENRASESVYYLTTELASDNSISDLLNQSNIQIYNSSIVDILRYFTSGQFVYDAYSRTWQNYAREWRVSYEYREDDGWVASWESRKILQAVKRTCFSLFDSPSKWKVLDSPTELIVSIKFVPLRLKIGSLVETKVTFMLHTVKAIHEEEVLLTTNISNSRDTRSESLNNNTFLLPKNQIFPHVSVLKVDARTRNMFETAMGLCIRERILAGERFLSGDFTRKIPRIPELGVQLMKSVALENDSNYSPEACCRLGNYYNDVAEEIDYQEAERWY